MTKLQACSYTIPRLRPLAVNEGMPDGSAIERLLLLTDDAAAAAALARTLGAAGAVEVRLVEEDRPIDHRPTRTFVDIDLSSGRSIERARGWLRSPLVSRSAKWALVTPDDYRERKQALALGADRLVDRPLEPEVVLSDLRDAMAEEFESFLDRVESTPLAMGLRAGQNALASAFLAVPKGEPIDVRVFDEAAVMVAGAIAEEGLSGWLSTVQHHHSSSYRHSLLVAGGATCFAHFIGASRADQARVARAALLHDVGKSLIPLAILDKPGKLDEAEEAQIRLHPQYGHDLLVRSGGFSREMLDAVLDHHEMCDGSGYPRGLSGSQIGDLTRIVTLADIFAALVEERSYKPALSRAAAIDIMVGMGPKLDPDLLGVFRRMALSDDGRAARAATRAG